ncbi:MAG: YdiU family protein, partial [Clostridium sp.]
MTTKEEIIEIGWNLDNSYARLPKVFSTRVTNNPVTSPKLIILNHPLATSLGLNVKGLEDSDGVEVMSGNRIPEGGELLAQAYAGHQFGHFTMLGDGRTMLIGEQVTPLGKRFDIQLKGSGRTPYSRGGDGRAGLSPMLREYIISEAMYSLGIPTTRSLGVVTTGEAVIRRINEPGAILTRVAASHIRVGTFEYASKWGTVEELRALADYTLQRHFPDFKDDENKYLFLLQEVIKGQAKLISKWQLVGFIHGVMNTDNMAISGESIDYGPCAFMDVYDPETVFSSIDTYGRYSYGNQPDIAMWNIRVFAKAILPLIHIDHNEALEIANNEIIKFVDLYKYNWLMGMRGKLGIFNEEIGDESLAQELLDIMDKYAGDYTNTFIALTFNKTQDIKLFETDEFDNWNKLWKARLDRQEQSRDDSHKLMRNSNPGV